MDRSWELVTPAAAGRYLITVVQLKSGAAPSTRTGHIAGLVPVPRDPRASTVRVGEMLGPGGMKVSTYLSAFSMSRKMPPAPRAVATPNLSKLTNRCEELRGFFCSNLIFDSDKDGARVVVCWDGLILGGGQSPVIPGG